MSRQHWERFDDRATSCVRSTNKSCVLVLVLNFLPSPLSFSCGGHRSHNRQKIIIVKMPRGVSLRTRVVPVLRRGSFGGGRKSATRGFSSTAERSGSKPFATIFPALRVLREPKSADGDPDPRGKRSPPKVSWRRVGAIDPRNDNAHHSSKSTGFSTGSAPGDQDEDHNDAPFNPPRNDPSSDHSDGTEFPSHVFKQGASLGDGGAQADTHAHTHAHQDQEEEERTLLAAHQRPLFVRAQTAVRQELREWYWQRKAGTAFQVWNPPGVVMHKLRQYHWDPGRFGAPKLEEWWFAGEPIPDSTMAPVSGRGKLVRGDYFAEMRKARTTAWENNLVARGEGHSQDHSQETPFESENRSSEERSSGEIAATGQNKSSEVAATTVDSVSTTTARGTTTAPVLQADLILPSPSRSSSSSVFRHDASRSLLTSRHNFLDVADPLFRTKSITELSPLEAENYFLPRQEERSRTNLVIGGGQWTVKQATDLQPLDNWIFVTNDDASLFTTLYHAYRGFDADPAEMDEPFENFRLLFTNPWLLHRLLPVRSIDRIFVHFPMNFSDNLKTLTQILKLGGELIVTCRNEKNMEHVVQHLLKQGAENFANANGSERNFWGKNILKPVDSIQSRQARDCWRELPSLYSPYFSLVEDPYLDAPSERQRRRGRYLEFHMQLEQSLEERGAAGAVERTEEEEPILQEEPIPAEESIWSALQKELELAEAHQGKKSSSAARESSSSGASGGEQSSGNEKMEPADDVFGPIDAPENALTHHLEELSKNKRMLFQTRWKRIAAGKPNAKFGRFKPIIVHRKAKGERYWS